MKILFLMKPLAYVKPDKDTSVLLMQACQRLGHDIYFLPGILSGIKFNAFLRNFGNKKLNGFIILENKAPLCSDNHILSIEEKTSKKNF